MKIDKRKTWKIRKSDNRKMGKKENGRKRKS